MMPVAPDEILTSLNTEGERAREGEGEKKKKTIGLFFVLYKKDFS
jgi:hypothetical protein